MELSSILTCLKTTADLIKENVSFENSLYGVCIPPSCGKSYLCNNVISETIHFIDIDKEAENDLDSDDKEDIKKKQDLNISRIIYTKSKTILNDFKDILQNSSCKNKTLVLVSSDYRLLKYNQCTKILYMMPTDLLIQQFKNENPNFNNEKFIVCKNDLIQRKSDKLIIYNSKEQLLSLLCEKFKCKLKI
jgi:hypothetical protein